MRLPSLFASFLTAVAFATPCLAQSLEVRAGAPVRIEIAHFDAAVEEGVARVVVDETFRNQTAAVQEGVYRFKLPEDAVIGSFSMWMEGREKQGRVLEARQARAVYDSIVAKRKDPGLLEQIGWREFRVNVFPIPAGNTVRVRLAYAHLLRDDLGLETLELPLPQGAGAVGDLHVHAEMKAARGLAGLDCPSHKDAIVKLDEAGARADWTGDGVAPNGPFVLRAIPKRTGFDVSLLASRPEGAAEGWFVARVVPRLETPPKILRDVVFVVDRSGSMEGKKMDQARAALVAGLATLKPGDRFDVVSFSTDVASLGGGLLLDATPENLDAARRAARELTASGGTNIADALAAAVGSRVPDPARFCAVVFLTDGDPTVGETNPDKILAAWRAKGGGTRLFAFGVGADVKDFLLTKLALEGRGDARYVREDEDLEVKLGALYERVRTPLLLDPSLDVEGDGVEVLDREPRRLPDLFQGRALVAMGRYKGAGKAVLHLRGRCGAAEIKLDVPVEFPAATPARPHVAQIWAKARIERVLDDMRVLGANREFKDEVLRLGLTHQLVTPYTSFLVVEDGVRIPDAGESARLPQTRGGDVADAPPEVIDRAAIPVAQGPVNPDEVIIPDADAAPLGGGASQDDSGVNGGTSIGVGTVGHFGTGVPTATGGVANPDPERPSPFVSRRAGAGGRGGGGLGQGGGGTGGATKQTEGAVMWALRWLKNHQSPDGHWDAAGFDAQCKLDRCDGVGAADGNLRATGLALLAFLGAGETHQSGSCRETVKNGLKWLRDVQDAEGCFGPRTSPHWLRDHAVAGLAMAEAYGMTGSRVFKEPAQRAIAFALQTKSPGLGWSRAVPSDGVCDVETTGWMTMLLKSGVMAELDVDKQAIRDACADVEKATDAATGRVEGAEAFTAIGGLVRIYAGRTPADDETLVPAVGQVVAKPPKWAADGAGADSDAWYFGTLFAFQMGGESWKRWNEAVKTALLDHQRAEADEDARGSWDPVGVGAAEGGRVVATALGCIDLEVYYRYGRVITISLPSGK